MDSIGNEKGKSKVFAVASNAKNGYPSLYIPRRPLRAPTAFKETTGLDSKRLGIYGQEWIWSLLPRKLVYF